MTVVASQGGCEDSRPQRGSRSLAPERDAAAFAGAPESPPLNPETTF